MLSTTQNSDSPIADPMFDVMLEVLLVATAGLVAGWLAGLLLPKSFRDESLGGSPIVCPGCQAPLGVTAVIPGSIVRCPHCGRNTWARPLIAAGSSAVLFIICYLEFDDTTQALLGGIFCTIFIALTLTDIERRLLPNRIVYPATLLAIATAWLFPEMSFFDSLLGGLIAVAIAGSLLLFSLIFGAGAFGIGDVKVIIMLGFLLGPAALGPAILIAMLSTAVFAGGAILTRQLTLKDYIPHGPFLALGGIVGLLWGNEIWDWYAG
jgi:prepilin signal peptidase PulO-like enzyme (type II secretory pathway)